MTKKSSLFNTFSAGLILSCLGMNVFKCEASVQEETRDGSSKPAVASSAAVLHMPESEPILRLPELHPIKIPTTDELQGNTFWHELVSLQATDSARKARGPQGQEAFSAVTNLATLFEEYKNASIIPEGKNFIDILTQEGCKIKVVLNDHEMELPEFRQTLELSIRQWPILKDCFFSLNQSVLLFRKRILADFKHKQEEYVRINPLLERLKILDEINESSKKEWKERKKKLEEDNQALKQEKQELTEENERLRAEAARLRAATQEAEEDNQALKQEKQELSRENQQLKDELTRIRAATQDVAIEIPQTKTVNSTRKTGFWAWVFSWFKKDTGEKQRLLDHEN